MARKSKRQAVLFGLVFVVVGIGLAIWGYEMSNSVGSQLNQVLSGSPADRVLQAYIGGGVCLAIGLFILSKK